MNVISQTWPWYLSGFLIGLVMFLLIYFGKTFGMSTNLRVICSYAGAGKFSDFFRFDYKAQTWNLVVVLGAMIGGYIAVNYLSNAQNVTLSSQTLSELKFLNIDLPNGKLAPDVLFGKDILNSPKAIFILLIGGILLGFGARYAGGCTSGHAIQGLSNLQWQSLKAVIGFFIGGLIVVHFIFPLIF